jgi:pyruvate kinase
MTEIVDSPADDPRPAATPSAKCVAPLLGNLQRLGADLLQMEAEWEDAIQETHPTYRASARNLVHYLALRRHDIRQVQEELAALGLSSLGRTESHVLAGLDAVGEILGRLAGIPLKPRAVRAPAVGIAAGRALLHAHTEALLGPVPARRSVRIMVTMPAEAADDYALVKQLVENGMDCMRINCAHDGRDAWHRMVAHLRRARRELGRECRVLMDLAGSKLRTGPIAVETQVLKWGPQRDLYGRVTTPAHIWLTPAETPEAPPPVPVDGTLRIHRRLMDEICSDREVTFTDLRGKARALQVGRAVGRSYWAAATQTAYLRAGSVLQVRYHGASVASGAAEVGAPSLDKQFITLKPGDPLLITKALSPGTPATHEGNTLVAPATIGCTLPAVFGSVRAGEPIWFDDGKIGGVIETVEPEILRVRITSAKSAGSKLGADKGINLPESDLRLPGMTHKDVGDLEFIAEHADIVGLSFVKRIEDVLRVQQHLADLHADHLGLILKIETRSGFEQLPNLLLSAMRRERIGVMIARGDLAVECGYERLAEVQEEMLWICEAAHVPVIWATQVLETLAKKGVPSRAEITDAAMGERAECVMLNKGPYLIAALRALEDITRRMETHQSKKSARLRSLGLSARLVRARPALAVAKS